MNDKIKLELPRNHVGQILDCLRIAAEDWNRTRLYLENGFIDPNEPYIRECSSAHEAQRIEEYYRNIIAEIEKQLAV